MSKTRGKSGNTWLAKACRKVSPVSANAHAALLADRSGQVHMGHCDRACEAHCQKKTQTGKVDPKERWPLVP